MLTKIDLSQIRGIVKDEIAPVKKDVRKIKETMGVMLNVLDKEDIALQKRVERLEEHVGISS